MISMILGGIVVAMVAVFFMFGRQNLEEKNQQYQKRIENLKHQIGEEEERQAQLEEQKKYVQTKKYIEDVAKSKLGLLYPDELILKPTASD